MRPLLGLAGLAAGLLMGSPVQSWAQTYQAYGRVDLIVTQAAPEPREVLELHPGFSWLNDARATQLSVLDPLPLRVSVGGRAEGRFEGRIGTLKAYAAAFYPGCCTVDGVRVINGYAWVAAGGGFYDELLVQGAGLPVGSPVRYELELRIDGRLSSPHQELGGYLSAYALAGLSFIDLSTGLQQRFSWDATRQAPGSYRLGLDTVVGHRLAIASTLQVGASVDALATLARGTVADYGHSAYIYLQPSVAGLNSVGVSGHDFLAPVPEPGSAALFLAGFSALAWLARRRASAR